MNDIPLNLDGTLPKPKLEMSELKNSCSTFTATTSTSLSQQFKIQGRPIKKYNESVIIERAINWGDILMFMTILIVAGYTGWWLIILLIFFGSWNPLYTKKEIKNK